MVRDSSLILAPRRQRFRSLRACHVIVALLRDHVRFQVAVSTWLLYRTFCLDASLLKARLSQGLSSVWRSSVVQ